MIDVASGVQAVVQYVSGQLNLPQHSPAASAAAYNSFADAIVANAASDTKKTDAAFEGCDQSRSEFRADRAVCNALLFRAGKGT